MMTNSFNLLLHAQRVLVSVAVLGGLLLLDGQLGPLTFVLGRVVASVILAMVVLGAVRPEGRWPSFLACWAGVALTALLPTVALSLSAYVFTVAMVGVHTVTNPSLVVPGLPQSCFTWVGLGFLPTLVPQARVLTEALTDAARGYLRAATGAEHHLSLTALGGPAVLALGVFLLWRWRWSGSSIRLLAAAALPVAWFLLLPAAVLPSSTGPTAIFARGAYYGLFWLACAAIVDSVASRAAAPASQSDRRPSRIVLLSGCAVSLLAGLILSGVVNPFIPANRSVLVHNRGGLDWERPVWGKFGSFSGGMFGLLPVYAGANGYSIDILDRDTIAPDDLSGFQTLVLINSPKRWEGEELRTVRDFVANGGSLLVLGDHTDVFGLMDGFNSLLPEFGIRFEFDSAYHSRPTWRGCCSTAPDATASDWDIEYPGVAIGASLRLDGAARPLLTGRYAHSDLGVRENVVGAFLGNYHYDEAEKLGDTVLIATATHGRGRVVVFGDTTPYQGASSYSFSHTVCPIFEILSRPIGWSDRPEFRTTTAAFLLAALLAWWVGRAGAPTTAAGAAALFLGLAGGWIESRAYMQAPPPIDSDCFLIDESHFPAVGHYEAKVNPSGSLNNCLSRSGLRVAHLYDWDQSTIAKTRGIAFISPRRPFTPEEVEDLLRFEEAGGVVILAVGQPDCAPSRSLLHAHGLDLEPRPLGTVPAIGGGPREKEQPRFLDAWPIVDTSGRALNAVPDVDILYRFRQDVCALFARRGRGGLFLISDTRFFSSMNIEDLWGHWAGNLALIHDVFRNYLKIDPDAVRPLFRSPSKPE